MKTLDIQLRKNQKGVTMIALVITIMVLIILSGISIKLGQSDVKDTKETALFTELGMVQNAILQRKTKIELIGEKYPGEVITESGINLEQIFNYMNEKKSSDEKNVSRKDIDDNNYYLLNKTGLSNMGITNSKYEYIVNYKTGEVINYTIKVTESGKILYLDT